MVDENNSGARPFENSPFPSAALPDSEFESGPKKNISTEAIGNSGTQIFGGYFSEEYLNELRGRQGAKLWDQMRRSDATIAMLMNAIINPIKAANWSVDPCEEGNAEFDKQAELCEFILKDQIDFQKLIHEALTVIPFGFSMFEVIHNAVISHPKFGTFNGLKALSFRSQKTIENWILEPATGVLKGVNQYTYSDLGGNKFIPGEFLLILSLAQEGDNYEGISALRPMLGAYKRKDLYLKLAAIGIEKYAVGVPIGTIPKGKEKLSEVAEFKKTLQNYTSHEAAYITVPEGWEIEIQKSDFDASKIKEMLTFENTEMINAVVANFLALGMNGAGGAFALGTDLSEFFTAGIQSYADLVCYAINRNLFPSLVKLNFGEQQGYPKLKCTGISDKAGKEFAEIIKLLTESRALDSDQPLKEFIRKQYKMPKPDLTTTVPAAPVEQMQFNERVKTIKLSDNKYVAKFDRNKKELKDLMHSNLKEMYESLKETIRKKYNSLPKSQKIKAVQGLEMPGQAKYKAALRDFMGEVASDSIDMARKQVPSKKNVKLAEGPFSSLPTALRNLILTQVGLLVDTQTADVEKAVFFQFASSAAASEDIDAILFDIDSNIEDGVTKSMSVDAAAGDAIAQITNQASLSFLMAPEVMDGIESFTFTNESPDSDICQELAGRMGDYAIRKVVSA